jgi:hypothetical protein
MCANFGFAALARFASADLDLVNIYIEVKFAPGEDS